MWEGGCVWEEGVWESVCVGGECGRSVCVGGGCVWEEGVCGRRVCVWEGGYVCGRGMCVGRICVWEEGVCVGGGYASHCVHRWFHELILLLQIKT